jgi:pimeloyl-ACP methyl ester carboxylesterase
VTDAPAAIRLPDGRRLAWSEYGAPDGAPVLYFHGSPSSRREPSLLDHEAPVRAGLRLISPDRPGMGDSDFLPGRRLTHWPSDVSALADALGLRRFAVMGNSGGAPYVGACAAAIPDRITAAVIVSGGWRMDWPEARDHVPRMHRLVFTLARRAPPLLRLLLSGMGSVGRGDREKELGQMKRRVHPADHAVFSEPGRLEAFAETMHEAMKQGTRGAAWDMTLYVRDFGFAPEDARIPVTWFHGALDLNAPVQLARRVTRSWPGARLVTFPEDAHLSTLCRHFQEIAAALAPPCRESSRRSP